MEVLRHVKVQYLRVINTVNFVPRYQFRSKEEGKPDSRRKTERTANFLEQLPKHNYEIDEEKARKETDTVRFLFQLLQFLIKFCMV